MAGNRTGMVVLVRAALTLGLLVLAAGCSEAPVERVAVTDQALDPPRTYHISTAGNDQNPGYCPANDPNCADAQYAWKSLDTVYVRRAQFNPGDRILLKRGDVFSHQLFINQLHGTAQAPITLGAYPDVGPKPVIVAAGQALDWEPAHPLHPDCWHATISDPAITSVDQVNQVSAFFYEGVAVAEAQTTAPYPGPVDPLLSQFTLSGNGSYGPTRYKSEVYFCKAGLASKDRAYLQANARVFTLGIGIRGSSYVVVQDIEVNGAFNGVAIDIADNVTVRRVATRNTIHFGLQVFSSNCPKKDVRPFENTCSQNISILDSTFRDSNREPMWIDHSDNVRIVGNEIGPIVDKVFSGPPPWDQCCAYPHGDLSGLGIRDSKNAEVAYNTIHDIPLEHSAVDVDLLSRLGPISIHHNVAHNVAGWGVVTGTTINYHHNIVAAAASAPTRDGAWVRAYGPGISTVYNNAFYGAGTNVGLGVAAYPGAFAYVMNNLVYAVNTIPGFAYTEYEPTRALSRNNAFYGQATAFRIGTATTLAQAQPGSEQHSFLLNPNAPGVAQPFVSATPATASDFRLSPSSAARGAGVDPKTTSAIALAAPSPAFDITGTIPSFDGPWGKDGAGFDIGAFEASDSEALSLASGLLLSDHFDEHSPVGGAVSMVDATGHNYHGIPYDGVTPTVGKLDGAVDLDGSSGRIEYGTLGGWSPTTFSVAFWMKSVGAGPGGVPRIFARKLTLDYYPSNDKLNFDVAGTLGNSAAKTSSLTEGVWHHIVCTYDDSGDRIARIYVDGGPNVPGGAVFAAPAPMQGNLITQAAQYLLVGRHTSQNNFFKGQLDELNIWTRMLDPVTEIPALYNAGSGRIVQADPTLAVLSSKSLNFLLLQTANYGAMTGATAEVSAAAKGANLKLTGSGWKRVLFNYAITPNTHLAFAFRSTAQGEVQAIGLDNDDVADPTHTIQLHGTNSYGQQSSAPDYARLAGSGWQTYDIPLYSVYGGGGTMSRVFFANQGASAVSEFSNVYLYEAP